MLWNDRFSERAFADWDTADLARYGRTPVRALGRAVSGPFAGAQNRT